MAISCGSRTIEMYGPDSQNSLCTVLECACMHHAGSRDTTLIIWDIIDVARSGRLRRAGPPGASLQLAQTPRHVLHGHEDAVTCLALSPALDLIVSAAADGTLLFHTLGTGRCDHQQRSALLHLQVHAPLQTQPHAALLCGCRPPAGFCLSQTSSKPGQYRRSGQGVNLHCACRRAGCCEGLRSLCLLCILPIKEVDRHPRAGDLMFRCSSSLGCDQD